MRNQSRAAPEATGLRTPAGAPTRAALSPQGAELPIPLCIQCAPVDPLPASPRDVLHLQRLAGNRAVSHFLSPAGRAPLVQARLRVGPSGDRYEQEADRGASSPLPDDVRAYMEPRFGAGFGGVRLHTGAEATQLNREIQARAFTHGRDIYIGEGGLDPASSAGKELLAHELTHVVQQTGVGQAVQPGPLVQRARAKRGPKGSIRWLSDGKDDTQQLTKSNGVITATAGGGGLGHTWIWLEWLDARGIAHNVCCELTFAGFGVSGSDIKDEGKQGLHALLGGIAGPLGLFHGKKVIIKIDPKAKAQWLRNAGTKRSWVRTRAQILNALHKARLIQHTAQNYIYTLSGRMWFTRKKPINCARFGQKLLKAAGVPASEASAGFIWKAPYQLATGQRKFTKKGGLGGLLKGLFGG